MENQLPITKSDITHPNNVMVVPTHSKKDFFKWWCVFMRPFINLSNREIDVVSSLLEQRWELSQTISDSHILDTLMMSEGVRKKVLDGCHITLQNYYVVIGNLKKRKVIINNAFNPKLIPNIRSTDNGCFKLTIAFKETEGGQQEEKAV